MRRLIWGFAGCTYHIVGNLMSRLICFGCLGKSFVLDMRSYNKMIFRLMFSFSYISLANLVKPNSLWVCLFCGMFHWHHWPIKCCFNMSMGSQSQGFIFAIWTDMISLGYAHDTRYFEIMRPLILRLWYFGIMLLIGLLSYGG